VWEDSRYCWVVFCKNHWFHFRQALFSSQRIPLGETDAVMPPPALSGRFRVRCDVCGKQYFYRPSEVRKYEQELPEPFAPHPLFRGDGERRRSERQPREVILLVRGESVEKGAFGEEALASSLSAHGALIGLSAPVQMGQTLILRNLQTQSELAGRVVRLETSRGGGAQVGVEFLRPTPDYWPIAVSIKRQSTTKKRKVWANLTEGCRELAVRLMVWLRSSHRRSAKS
jgi:hypothetical protein